MKLKNISLLLFGAAIGTFTACQDKGWDVTEPVPSTVYGNQSIQETNVISIAELKKLYPDYAANYTCTKMTTDAVLKVYVTGNDVEDNFSNGIAVQDENGDAMIICVNERSMFGYLPVGQQILFSVKDLYIGGYGSQPQVGTPYKKNESDNLYVSRMPSHIWQQHFKILPNVVDVKSKEYTVSEFKNLNIANECGKLMTIKDVTIAKSGKNVWAATEDAGSSNCVEKVIQELGSNYVVYTSTYADFSKDSIPSEKMNLTGIWKRYNNKWELILRSKDDIKIVK
ncbi:MAG: hypothetical protein HUK03_07975 [Bacteroidaceae bacterium]|nr:hypothetical protein [Bacteroidaceae bacterium]